MKSKSQDQTSKISTAKKPKDLKPKQDAKGGIGLLLPAVQKVREAAGRG